MAFGSEGEEQGIGLALSGGGYRAMLFHLGSVWRLNELGLLPQLDRISSVSGGSLTAGRLAVRWRHLNFQSGVATNFRDEVVEPVVAFSDALVDVPAVLVGLVPLLSAATFAERFYNRYLVERASLRDLPDRPHFVFNATHFASATSWRFSRPYMGCYRLGLVRDPDIQLARALAASAAFPPFLSPLTLTLDPKDFERVEGADLYDREDLRRTVALSDGGVYDNLGLETVWGRYSTVLSSDAGGLLSIRGGSYWHWPGQLQRVIDTATEQARALRRRALVSDYLAGRKKGTLWRTGTHLDEYPAQTPFPVHDGWAAYLAGLPTRLAPFTDRADAKRLVNWGYLVADVALRSWVLQAAPVPDALPYPQAAFARHRPHTGPPHREETCGQRCRHRSTRGHARRTAEPPLSGQNTAPAATLRAL